MEHTAAGFRLTILNTQKTMDFTSAAMPSVQTEYDYRGRGKCIVLSTKDCCYYLYPMEEGFNVTKIQFAAERFYKITHES